MRCEHPKQLPGGIFRCGKCPPCRINSKRQWTGRLVSEWIAAPSSLFVTLTYDDQNLPADGSLNPQTVQLFLKRLRAALGEKKFRFFAVGEYGEKTFRPHYHAIFFGLERSHIETIQTAWGLGFTHTGEVNLASLNYCTGYTLKKMTKGDDPRLGGRTPEFVRYSLKPGLGAAFCAEIAQGLMTHTGAAALGKLGDVPHQAHMAGKMLPISNYRRRWLRQQLGWEAQMPHEAREKLLEMQTAQLRQDAELKAQGRDITKAHSLAARRGISQSLSQRKL